MENTRNCKLINLQTQDIHMLKNKDIFILGRNITTLIKDKFVSKSQIACVADLKKCSVKLKAVGEAVSGLNGYALKKGVVYTVGHGDVIEVRLGYHKFQIIFDPEPPCDGEPKAKKPKMSCHQEFDNTAKAPVIAGSSIWESIENNELLIYTHKGCKASNKIAGFDIDGTIIKTKSGARFPKNMDDWTFYFDQSTNWKSKLKYLHTSDYKIVFFTNQSGVGKDVSKIKEFKRKIENIVSSIDLPIQVFIATGKTIYRKPRPGMWNLLTEEKNDSVAVDKDLSFYVGDAAGREKNWAPKKNKDHSCADRLFAENIGLTFYTPEEYFLKSRKVIFKLPDFDPKKICKDLYPDISYDKLNVVIMVGGPGSGKSFFCKKNLVSNGYIHVNRDTLGSWQKCVKAMENALENKKNVVIDNTNGDKEARKRFIDAAKKLNAHVRCFVMSSSLDHMRHNNIFRELTDKSHAPVSDIIIYSYNKNYQDPELSEGFSQILRIPFVPEFTNSDLEKLYKMYLLEK